MNVTDLTFIPYNIDSYIYYDNEPHKVIDLLLSNDVVSYRLSDIEGNSPYKLVNIADKKITNKLKKTKEKQPAISNNNNNNNNELPEIIMEMSQQPKNKYAVLLSQRYNKMVEQLNKTSKFMFKTVPTIFINKLITKYKISFGQIDKIIKTLKKTQNHTLEIYNIEINPFNFIRDDIQILTFEKANKICNDNEIDIPFDEKCIKYIFDLFRKSNTFYIESRLLYWHIEKFCSSNSKNHKDYIDTINSNTVNKKINNQYYKTTQYLIDFEKSMTDLTMDLFYEKEYDIPEKDILSAINQFEINENIVMTEEQVNAVKNSLLNKFNIILGFPGTGKSTIVKCILYIFSIFYKHNCISTMTRTTTPLESSGDNDVNICKYPSPTNTSLLGPTGLSYVGLAAKCGFDNFSREISGTCHRVIYNQFPKIMEGDEESGEKEIDKELSGIFPQLLIIDEFSMIDSFMFNDILESCKYFGCRLIVIGDDNQLPSIGPGQILESLIRVNVFTESKLTEIKRNNGLLMINIKKMASEIITATDFKDESIVFIDIDEFLDEENKLEYYKICQLIHDNKLTKDNSKFLSYFKNEKYECNVTNLNNIIQSIFNKHGNPIPSRSKFADKFQFKEGDIIIRIENDYKSGDIRANGEHAVILRKNNYLVIIKYLEDDKEVTVDIDTLYNEFMLAYSLTVHKSQGSQYDYVIIFIDKNQSIWDKKALYTAISRAKTRCIIIGKMNDFIKIQYNNSSDKISNFMKESDEYDFIQPSQPLDNL